MRFTTFCLVGFRHEDLTRPEFSHKYLLGVKFVLTRESDLLQLSTQQMKRIALDGQHNAQERQYMKSLCCSVENGDGNKELSFLHYILIPIKTWTYKQLGDYHTYFHEVS